MNEQESLGQRFQEGRLHAKIHLETSLQSLTSRIAPIHRSLTLVGMAAILPNKELKERAENIVKHHGFLTASRQITDPEYLLSTPTGIQIKSYEGIMDLQFLSNWERILLHEFLERMELGEYPEIVAPSVQHTRDHGSLD